MPSYPVALHHNRGSHNVDWVADSKNAEKKAAEKALVPDSEPEKAPTDQPQVAVIAVHGVADQAPNDSVEAIANLLLNLNDNGRNVYSPFRETHLRVPLRRVALRPELDPEETAPRSRNPFDEQTQNLRSYQAQKEQGTVPAELTPDYVFMLDQLREYEGEGPEAAYETLRLEGRRLPGDDQPGIGVHVYEMYWADLSRLKTGLWRFLGELYQVLFHVSSLGRQTVVFAAMAQPHSTRWKIFRELQEWAARFLTVPIPILNLFLLAVILTVLPGNLPLKLQPWISWLILSAGVIAVAGYYLFRITPRLSWWIWAFLPVAASVAAILLVRLAAHFFGRWHSFGHHQLLALEWCAIATLALIFIIRAYDARRPGVAKFARFAGIPLLLFLVIEILINDNDKSKIAQAALQTTEILYLGINISWTLLIIFSLAAWLAGKIAIGGAETETDRDVAKRVVWTARLTLAIPSFLSFLLTIVLWSAIYKAGVKLFPVMNYVPWRMYPTFDANGPLEARVFLWDLIVDAGTTAFGAMMGFFCLVFVLIVWSLFPLVWAEIHSPGSGSAPSASYGIWLNRGFGLLRIAGQLVLVAVSLVLPVVVLASRARLFDRFRARGWSPLLVSFFDNTFSAKALLLVGGLIVGSTIGLLAFRGTLDVLSLHLRTLLDVVLDVGNHLRMYPQSSTPRAKICARYVSLLRYLCHWRDSNSGVGYESIIIVAHSQGAVITADLLRFLQKEPDPELTRLGRDIPVYFFTMGCPLRQLYSLRFPHLYGWARHFDVSHWQEPHQPIPGNQKPDPKELAVTTWTNAYRSGDYVGRYLWRAEKCDYHWQDTSADATEPWNIRTKLSGVSMDEKGTRQEFCIGPGAHTHYWDGKAPAIAVQIDRMIRANFTDLKVD